MTEEEIKIQKALGTYLSMKWKECQELFKEADDLYEESNIYKEGDKLCKAANILYREAKKLYMDAVKEVYGDKKVTINWDTGEVKLYD